MYLIVEFVGEGTTGTIAKSWYSDGHSWWPPFRDLDRLLKSVRMMEAPQPDKGWTKHQVRILHESASFDNIAKKWKKACYTSDISETEMPGKRIHKKKIYTSDDEPHDTPHKKKKIINKEKVLPAAKAPLANIKTKGPVVRPLLTPSRAGKSFSNCDWLKYEKYENHRQKLLSISNTHARFTKSVRSCGSPVVPVSLSQADEPWHEHPPAIQAPVVPVSLSQADEPWHEHPPAIQEDTISEPRPSSTHQARTQRKLIGAIWKTHVSKIQTHRLHSLMNSFSLMNEVLQNVFKQRAKTVIKHVAVAATNHNSLMAPIMHCGTGFTDEMRITISRFKSPSASGVRRWSRISDQCTPVERMILETLQELDMKVNHLTSVVQSLAGRSNVPVLVVDSEDDVFPLTSMEDLDNLERQLSERGMMQKMGEQIIHQWRTHNEKNSMENMFQDLWSCSQTSELVRKGTKVRDNEDKYRITLNR
ncbi:unnamed protein product [Leuciscus chuanchicus]